MANLATNLDERIEDRWNDLDGGRNSHLMRARTNAALTIPKALPPEGLTSEMELPNPYSSLAGRGVTQMASKILSALIPLNDQPFFQFQVKDGVEPDAETYSLLEAMSYQVYDRIRQGNLRDAVYQCLQSLIITGDALLYMYNDFTFGVYRVDNYVVVRDFDGTLREAICIHVQPIDPNDPQDDYLANGNVSADSYRDLNQFIEYHRYVRNDEKDGYDFAKFGTDGKVKDEGFYKNCPLLALRWNEVCGEHYGRSHVEDNFGDIQTLEAYTTSMIESTAAASTFFMGIDPTGVTELTDLAASQNGDWVAARQQDVYCVSPASTLKPQIDSIMNAIQFMTGQVAKAFLMEAGGVRQAERVTATEIRMMGQELETVLGGAFSAIARNLFGPIVRRAVQLMIEKEELDPRLAAEFSDEGMLSLDIVTGLQALSRDQDLNKLMQLGEVVRNLPPQAVETFNWSAYTQSIIASMGFDTRNWVRSEEDIKAEKLQMMQEQAAMQTSQTIAGAAAQGIAPAVGQQVAAAAGPQIAGAIEQGMS